MVTTIALAACYGKNQPSNAEPLAVEALASALKRRFTREVAVQIMILDEREDPTGAGLAKNLLQSSQIDIIGVSIPQSTYFLAVRFLERLATLDFRPIMILGHALPTYAPDIFLDKFPEILIVRGWGERAMCGIVEQYRSGNQDWAKVPSLVFRQEGQTVFTPVESPWSLAAPAVIPPRDFFARVEASRGCHHGVCAFCTRQPIGRNDLQWFRVPPDQVLSEIQRIKAAGGTEFTFCDEDFFGDDLDSAERIAQGIKDIGGMKFSLSLRADNIYNPRESISSNKRRLGLLILLKEAGLSLLFVGLESLSDTQLKRYRKGLRVVDNIRAVETALKLDIPLELGYILFDPLGTVSEFRENVFVLGATGFWKFTCQMLAQLTVRRDSDFESLLRSEGLLGRKKPHTIDYEYSFQDPVMGQIASACQEWKDVVEEIYVLARNAQRTTFKEGPCNTFVHEYRALQIDMLQTFAASVDHSHLTELSAPFGVRRSRLVRQLHDGIISSGNSTPAEKLTLDAAKRFLISNGLPSLREKMITGPGKHSDGQAHKILMWNGVEAVISGQNLSWPHDPA